MIDIGVVHGKFQIFHLRHLEYVLAAKMRCKTLIIGIENPDVAYIRDSVNNEYRSKKEANPFTYYERFEMIHDALLDFGVKREEFHIMPFPIDRPEIIMDYVPKGAVHYMSITDAWGEEKLKTLTALGIEVEVLWRKDPEEVGTTGAEITAKIVAGEEWRQLVPKSVYEYMVKHELEQRIKDLI